MESLKGKLLIASPSLPDPNFSRTVVLMIQHDKDGAFGIVLNRPSGKMVEEIWDHVSDQPCNKNRPINVGGPVAGPLIAVHTEPALGDLELGSGIYFSTDKTKLEQLLLAADLRKTPTCRFASTSAMLVGEVANSKRSWKPDRGSHSRPSGITSSTTKPTSGRSPRARWANRSWARP
jgi:hypothetical protein